MRYFESIKKIKLMTSLFFEYSNPYDIARNNYVINDSFLCVISTNMPTNSNYVNVHSLTHSWSRALLEKLLIVQLLENFPAFYGTRRFITAFT
jgi:hypothetical protein